MREKGSLAAGQASGEFMVAAIRAADRFCSRPQNTVGYRGRSRVRAGPQRRNGLTGDTRFDADGIPVGC